MPLVAQSGSAAGTGAAPCGPGPHADHPPPRERERPASHPPPHAAPAHHASAQTTAKATPVKLTLAQNKHAGRRARQDQAHQAKPPGQTQSESISTVMSSGSSPSSSSAARPARPAPRPATGRRRRRARRRRARAAEPRPRATPGIPLGDPTPTGAGHLDRARHADRLTGRTGTPTGDRPDRRGPGDGLRHAGPGAERPGPDRDPATGSPTPGSGTSSGSSTPTGSTPQRAGHAHAAA